MGMNTVAYLSSDGEYTSFTVGGICLRFRTSHNLLRYDRVKKWDKGYIVVDATYNMAGTVEDYIDLKPILENLRFNADKFLAPIREVRIRYDHQPA